MHLPAVERLFSSRVGHFILKFIHIFFILFLISLQVAWISIHKTIDVFHANLWVTILLLPDKREGVYLEKDIDKHFELMNFIKR